MSCASCGIRNFQNKVFSKSTLYKNKQNRWTVMNLNNCSDIFKNNDNNPKEHTGRMEGFHFYKELICENTANLCPDCTSSAAKQKIPYGSLASGLDLGSLNYLPRLTFLETLLITKYHPHLMTIKLKGENSVGLKGHVICYPHDGTFVSKELLFPDLKKIINVVFVGPRGLYEETKNNFKQITHFKVDSGRILQWLMFLKRNNYFFKF